MKKFIFAGVGVIIVVILIALGTFNKPERSRDNGYQIRNTYEYTKMKLESAAFENNGVIPPKYTCDGENISPPLKISEIPEGTKTLVLNVDDPDAPMGVWNHWLVWDIPPETTEIGEGQLPQGTIGKNSGGRFGYDGPCPPSGEHRYFFELWALDTVLNLPKETSKNDVEEALTGHVLAKAELMGRYNRR